GKPGAVIELKVLYDDETVGEALKDALNQLEEQQYETQLVAAGASPIYRYAALFDGKKLYLVTPQTWEKRFGQPSPA
ncbi:MAG: PD-(D/E)XK nuclease domain-containing protein, partial [Myxococcota bacterium]